MFFNRHKIQIVGVQIHIVVRRNHHGGFEFARQIVFAEHRLGGVAAFYAFFQRGGFGELLGGMQLFAIEPDFGVGQRFGQQMLADFFRPLISFAVQRRFHRIAGAQHVAVDIAGGSDGIEPQFVEPLMHGLDVVFEHAVKLKGLAVGEADGTIQGLRAGKLVDAQPLFGLDNATGQTAAQHHVFERLELLRHTLGADVAIVLLIHAVKADKLEIVAAKAA